jgi:enamine deaminase RidA (YjgF/YER057c/UK114 family)
MEHQRISSGSPWELIIGYSRAVRVGNQVWVSGTAPVWPDGSVDPDPGQQARHAFDTISHALIEAGGSLRDVVRTRIYLTSADDFDAVSAVHGELFAETRPANTTIIVAALLNAAWKVEIEVDAVIASRDRVGGG